YPVGAGAGAGMRRREFRSQDAVLPDSARQGHCYVVPVPGLAGRAAPRLAGRQEGPRPRARRGLHCPNTPIADHKLLTYGELGLSLDSFISTLSRLLNGGQQSTYWP